MIKSTYILIILLVFISNSYAQTIVNQYEVEILQGAKDDKKDTREINSIIFFEKESLTIKSRRKKDLLFKSLKYTDILSVDLTFAKQPYIRDTKRAVILTLLTINPVFLMEDKPKYWLTIIAKDDFAVIKLENDNFKLIQAEFLMRKFKVETIEEK